MSRYQGWKVGLPDGRPGGCGRLLIVEEKRGPEQIPREPEGNVRQGLRVRRAVKSEP